jgi:hypothetical protein
MSTVTKRECFCELCHPHLWLGAFDEALDKKVVIKTNDHLIELHRRKLEAARREREALALN